MIEIEKAYEAGRQAGKEYATIHDAVYAGAFDGAYHPTESTAWEMGFNGRELESVVGWRYGDLPQDGRSINYADNSYECGVSLMGLDADGCEHTSPQLEVANIAISNRAIVKVRGYLAGYGYDGEPLVIGAEIINDEGDRKSKERTNDDL